MRVVLVLGDIGDAAAVEAMVPHGLAELGAIDVLVFLASDASSYVTGDTIRVMGGRVIG